jgi:hypothetical protein
MTRRLHIQSGAESRTRIRSGGTLNGHWLVVTYPTACGRTVLDDGLAPLPDAATCRTCLRVLARWEREAKNAQPPAD